MLGYSGGAAVATQIILCDAIENLFQLDSEKVFRWAVFINGVTLLRVFEEREVEVKEGEEANAEELLREGSRDVVSRPSALRSKHSSQNNTSEEDTEQEKSTTAEPVLASLSGKLLTDGTPFLSNGIHGIARYRSQNEEFRIDIPTLHVRSLLEADLHDG